MTLLQENEFIVVGAFAPESSELATFVNATSESGFKAVFALDTAIVQQYDLSIPSVAVFSKVRALAHE